MLSMQKKKKRIHNPNQPWNAMPSQTIPDHPKKSWYLPRIYAHFLSAPQEKEKPYGIDNKRLSE